MLTDKNLSRRHFLKASLTVGAGLMMAACTQKTTPTPESKAPAAAPASVTKPPAPTAAKAAGKVTIICVNDQRPLVETVGVPAFTAKTGVTDIEIIDTAWNDVHEKIVTMAVGGSPMDVTYVDTIWPGEFAKAGFLLPLDTYMTDAVKADLFDVSWKQSVYKGNVYAMPYSANAKWLFYNKEMLAAAGISKPAETWDEFVQHSKACMDKGLAKYGISWGWMLAEGLTCDWTVFLYGFGGRWRAGADEQSGDWVFNSKEGVAALEFMKSTISAGGIGDLGSLQLNDRTDLNTFMAGETPYNVNWSYAWWFANNPQESKVAGKFGLTIWPAQPPVRSSSVTGGGGFGIMKATRDADLAWQLIEACTSKESQVIGLQKYSNPPVWKSIASDAQVLKDIPIYAEMAKQYEYAHFRPVTPWYTEWSQNMQTEIQNALTGAKTAQQALDSAVKFSNEGSKKYEG